MSIVPQLSLRGAKRRGNPFPLVSKNDTGRVTLAGFIAEHPFVYINLEVPDFGARLDSIADLLFYAVMLLRVFPFLWNTLPIDIWYAVAVILILRISAYGIAAVKYRRFASLHTYLNKLTGGAVFLIPFLLVTEYAAVYCRIACAIAVAAALEELVIHLLRQTYRANTKSFFQKEC